MFLYFLSCHVDMNYIHWIIYQWFECSFLTPPFETNAFWLPQNSAGVLGGSPAATCLWFLGGSSDFTYLDDRIECWRGFGERLEDASIAGHVSWIGVDSLKLDILGIRCQICCRNVWVGGGGFVFFGGGFVFFGGGFAKRGFVRTPRTPSGYGPGYIYMVR